MTNSTERWWDGAPRRLIQTNLNEKDILDFRLEDYIRSLKEFSADTVIFNTGGIIANYATELPWHFTNPHLGDREILGPLIDALHGEDIRIVARFDMSKINASLAGEYGDSLCRNGEGEVLNYNGQIQACVNSPYQQELALKTLEEALTRYPFDGIFFNMPGYLTEDYSGNYFGICQCDACRRRFSEFSAGLALPEEENPDLPSYPAYEAFRKWSCDDLFNKIRSTAKRISEDIAIFNYAETGVDVYRQESNSSLSRPLPEWEYSPHENISRVQTSWPEIQAMNSTVHFIDYPFRFNAVAPALSRLRTIQSIVQGCWLDYYVLGYLDTQADKACYPGLQELFSFHREHADEYGGTLSTADCCVICPDYRLSDASMDEFRGLARILTNAHIPFDVLDQRALTQQDMAERLSRYTLILVADADLQNEEWSLLKDYASHGGKLLASGFAARQKGARELFGIEMAVEKKALRSSYWKAEPEDRKALGGGDIPGLIFLDGKYMACKTRPGTETLLVKTTSESYGPPEKCFLGKAEETGGVFYREFGKGRTAYLPWCPGSLYERRSYHGHAALLLALISNVLGFESGIGGLHPLIQVFLRRRIVSGELQLSLINHTGQSGTEFFDPVPFQDLKMVLPPSIRAASVRSLRGGKAHIDDDGRIIKLDSLKDFDTLIFEEQP